jgi:4'-phosphopantetheinyl transferase EntD
LNIRPTLTDRFRSLFPSGVVTAELREPGEPALLMPAEAACLSAAAVDKRRREFAAGRLCARRAMAELGIRDFALRVASDRQPLWPDLIVGSITHTTGLCVAAVAQKNSVAAIGMDSEVVGGVTPDIWPTICIPAELAWLQSLPESDQPAAVTLIFSAKEAFYKCQYPMTGEWLNFEDLYIEPADWGSRTGAFRIQPTRSIGFAAAAPLAPMFGNYLFHEEFLSAGVALPAEAR